MNGRAMELRTWHVDRGRLGPVVAAVLLAAAVPVLFDYIPDALPVFALWAATLFGAGWWLCGFAPAGTVSRCRWLFSTAFVVRIVVVLLLVHFDFWQDDELLYHDRALLVPLGDLVRNPAELWNLGVLRYAVICQLIYRLLGYDTLGPRVFNAWLGSLIGVAVYLLARRQDDRRWAVHAGWLAALYPNLVLYSGFEMKDIGVALAVTVFLFALMERAHGVRSIGSRMLLLLGFVLACFLRLFIAVPLAVGFCWKLLEGRGRLARRALLAAGALAAVDLVLLAVSPGSSLSQHLLGTMTGIHVSMFDAGGTDDRSFFNGFAGGYTPVSLVLGFAYVFLVPFIVWPFTVEGAIYKMLAPGICVWYAAMPFAARGAFHLEEKGASTVFAVIAAALIGLTLGGGFHATGRHRIMIMPILLMYAARGFDDLRRGDVWARRLAIGYTVGLALGLVYYCSVKGM